MITSDHPFFRENFSMEREHYPLLRKHKAEGFVQVPNWMPIGWPTYEWVYPNGIDVMMRPAPRWWDRVRFQLTSALTAWWRIMRHRSWTCPIDDLECGSDCMFWPRGCTESRRHNSENVKQIERGE